jgi:Signal transduction histidine kinase
MAAVRHPALVDCIEEALARRSTRRTRFLNSEFGRDATYEVSASPIDGTQARGLLITFLDVTEREQVSQIRRDFVANVSHELKTPLTALMGFIETLKGPAREDAAARARFLDIMEREAARMNRLVHDLLSLSRVEAEERMRPDARVNIVALVNSAVVMLRPIAEEKQVRIEIAGHVQPLEVQGDPDQLMQVFTNLIENAIKYGGSESCVTVQITPLPRVAAFRGPGLQVEVCDEGDGIAPHHLPRLTERFYRVDTHRSREMGGTGWAPS